MAIVYDVSGRAYDSEYRPMVSVAGTTTSTDPNAGNPYPQYILRPSGGLDGQALVKSGTGHVYATINAAASNPFANTFVDATSTGGFVVPTQSFSTVPLSTEVSDAGNNFDTSTYFYTVPSTGLYLILARVRINDSSASSQFGVGVNTANQDGAFFQWQTSPGSSGQNRYTANYQRMANFTQGQQLRMYMYVEGGFPNNFNAAAMNVIRIS